MTLSLQKPAPGSGKRERWLRKQERKRETTRLEKRDRLEKAQHMQRLRQAAFTRDDGRDRVTGQAVKWEGSVMLRAHLHHIVHRGRGGTDTLDNVCIVSPHTHDRIHAGELQIEGDANGTLTVSTINLTTGRVLRQWESPNPTEGR